jgi:lipooligosaccharide transport system permease protein
VLSAFVLPRVLVHSQGRLRRATAVSARNLVAARHAAYWWVLASGFFEPLLYLLSIGVGVGALVGGFTLTDGRSVSYPAFVAPAMLASSAMNGAFAESTMNFFGKMKYMHLYDAVLATPVRPFEIALGELLWAMVRGAGYAFAFLGIMVAMGLTTPGRAVATFPVTMLVGFAFGGLGMALATFIRTWQDFDYLSVAQFALFLFSGTFAPPGSFPPVLRIVLEITPLYHGVELVRAFSTGALGPVVVWHVGYLVGLAAAGLAVAGRRMGRLLCP